MSEKSASYLDIFTTVIGNAIMFSLGAIACLATPTLLISQLAKLTPGNSVPAPPGGGGGDHAAETNSAYKKTWDAVLAVTLLFTAHGYLGVACYYYFQEDSVAEALLKGAIVAVGANIGVAASAGMVIWAMRWLR